MGLHPKRGGRVGYVELGPRCWQLPHSKNRIFQNSYSIQENEGINGKGVQLEKHEVNNTIMLQLEDL